MRVATFAAALALVAAGPAMAAPEPRIVSMDQCADQYVLALAPRDEIVALSKRALNADSHERPLAAAIPERRADLETILAERATIAVRYWTADARLPDALRARGVAVVQIDEANDFVGLRANVRKVAAALGRRAAGEALIADMDAKLARAHGAWRGAPAAYLTPGGFTAGSGTLVGAVMAAAGLRPEATTSGYAPLPLEALVLDPPAALVLAFFSDLSGGRQHWDIGDASRIEALTGRPAVASLPGSVLGCPAWYAADGAALLAAAAPKR
ncbi:MAG TPA: ABC transporter substrate-binding protein [Caulobacteraceae bacterium]|nr:ABC transporter substrate-binding protein [Caulobacteraceae bacterium]